jgi:hypothetical protein
MSAPFDDDSPPTDPGLPTHEPRTPFVLPAGLRLAITREGFTVRHPCDVVLEQTLGRPLERAEAGGDLTLVTQLGGVAKAGGVLRILHPGTLKRAKARRVVVERGPVSARALMAAERVEIGPVAIDIDVISAPEVVFDPAATGRVRVLDATSVLPAPGVTVESTWQAFHARHGDEALAWLKARAVTPLAQRPTPPPSPATAPPAAAAPQARPARAPRPVPQPAPGPTAAPPAGPAAPPTPPPSRATAAAPASPPVSPRGAPVAPPPAASAAPAAPPRAAAAAEGSSELDPRLKRCLDALLAAYPSDRPASVRETLRLATRDMPRLRPALDGLFTDLVRAHARLGAAPPPEVVRAMHELRTLAPRG